MPESVLHSNTTRACQPNTWFHCKRLPAAPAAFALLAVVVLAVFGGAGATAAEAALPGYSSLRRARNDNYDLRFELAPPKGAKRFDSVDLVFGSSAGKAYGRLVWDAAGVRLTRVTPAGEETITRTPQPLPDSLRGGGMLLLKRRPHWLEVVAGRERVLRVLDATIHRGMTGLRTGKGQALATAVHYQRVEPIMFGDDFMRTEDEAKDFGLWKVTGGEWKLYSVMERIRENPDARIREGHEPEASRSPNPFCLGGKTNKGGVILTGYPFWDDYTVSVSCKTTGGWMGLVFGAENEKNCWLVRWRVDSVGVSPGPVELVQRVGGRDRVVDSVSVRGRTDNWYRLAVTAVGSRIDVILDGTCILKAWEKTSVGGRIGLYVRSADETFFDDVTVRSEQSVRFDHKGMLAGSSAVRTGAWDVTDPDGDLRFRATGGPRSALYTLGLPHTSSGTFRAKIRAGEQASQFGLEFGLTDPGNAWRAVWTKSDSQLRLERVLDGRTTVVDAARCPQPALSGKTCSMMIDLREKSMVRVFVNDSLQLRARVPSTPAGQFGLAATSRDAVEFSDVEAFAEPHRDWEHPVKTAVFAADPYMQGWSSPRWAWVPLDTKAGAPERYEYKGDFYGAFQISLPISHGVALLFGLDTVDLAHGYRVQTSLEENRKQGRVRLTRNGRKLAESPFKLDKKIVIPGEQIVDEKIGALPKASDTVEYGKMTVSREGPYVWVSVDGKELLSVRDPNPLTGRTVGLEVADPLDLGKVEVHRDHVKDYRFERVAADWLKVGTWAVTNRFACDPRWSFLNGRSKGVAALWNKFRFPGDFTVEYYAGMRMRQGEMHEGAAKNYYPRVGDINLALCANGRDLFSGYDLILQAWDPAWSERWTQLLRHGEVAKQVDRELIPRTRLHRPEIRPVKVGWDPGGRPIHGAWYYVKVRRTGDRFDVWFDNTPVLSYTDPSPTAGDRIALWTQHNSIVAARVRVCYSTIDNSGALLAAAPAGRAEATVAVPARPTLACTTHWGKQFTFDQGLDGWKPFDGDESAGLRLVSGASNRGAHSLALTNLYAGGDFGAVLPVTGVDLGRVPAIEMDCAIPPEVKVNLYVTFKSDPAERFFITLSGSDTEGADRVRLGKFEGAKADGEWRRVRFNPAAALRRLRPGREHFIVASMVLGMFHEGYLNAGLGGNPEGATWQLDNVTFAGLGPMHAAFAWTPKTGNAPLAYRVLPSRGPRPDLSRASEKTGKTFSLDLSAPGLWFVYAETKGANGHWQAVTPIPLWADKPLAVATSDPAPGQAWGGTPIAVRFTPESAAYLNLATLKLTANGQPLATKNGAAVYDPREQVLRVDPAFSDIAFADKAPIVLALAYADALSGDNAPNLRTHKWTAHMSWAEDRRAPGRVRLTAGGGLYRDFDTGLDGVGPYSSGKNVQVSRVPRKADTRDMVLRVVNRICGSDFGVKFPIKKFSAGRLPVLTFDYRVDPYATVDFLLTTEMGTYALGFADTDTAKKKLGDIANVRKDGKWHHAEVDLADLLAQVETNFHANRYTVSRLALGDWGYAAAPPGAAFEIDNLTAVPVVHTAGGLSLSWTARDPSGIRAYSYLWSANPDAPVDEKPESVKSTGLFNDLSEGDQYFRVRACDGAGNWGPTATYRFRVDNTLPAIASVSPAPDTGAAEPEIKVRFKAGAAHLDPTSLALTMNGKPCILSRAYTSWNAETRELAWNWVRAARLRPKQTVDGATMAFKLDGIRDFAGNQRKAYEWTWHIDYSKDKKGPEAPRLYCASEKLLRFTDFSDGVGWWRAFSWRKAGTELSTVVDPDTKDACLCVAKTGKGRAFAAYGYAGRLNTKVYPYLTFDCKIPKGVKVNIILHIEGEWRYIRLTSEEALPEAGRVDGVEADGKWHHVWIDLPETLKKTAPDLEKDSIRYVALGNWSATGNPVGSKFYVDNFGILGSGAPVPEVYCSAADPTGVRGYSLALDRSPYSVPPADPAVLDTSRRPAVAAPTEPGLWFIHGRALDGAGNWGPAAHVPYYCKVSVLANAGDGIEAHGAWLVRGERGGSGVARIARAVGGGNAVLSASLRSARKGNLRLGQREKWMAPVRSVWHTAIFQDLDDPVRVAPYVRAVLPRNRNTGWRKSRYEYVTGDFVDVPPGRWVRDLKLELVLKHVGNGPVTCIERGLVIAVPGRARSTVLIDNLRVTPAANAPGA